MNTKIDQDTPLGAVIEKMKKFREETGRGCHFEGNGDGSVDIVFEGGRE